MDITLPSGEQITWPGQLAGEDLTAESNYGLAMKHDTDDTVIKRGSSGLSVGCLQSLPNDGTPAKVVAIGPAWGRVKGDGTAITKFLDLTVDTDSKYIPATSGTTIYARSFGVSIADGDLIPIYLVPPTVKA